MQFVPTLLRRTRRQAGHYGRLRGLCFSLPCKLMLDLAGYWEGRAEMFRLHAGTLWSLFRSLSYLHDHVECTNVEI